MASNEVSILISAKDQASSVLNGIKNQIMGIGAAYLSWEAAKSTIGEMINLASKEETGWIRVAGALRSHHEAVADNLPIMKQMVDALEHTLGVSRDVSEDGFNRMITAGYDVATAFKAIKLAADVAASSQFDMNMVLTAFIKGGSGSEMILRRIAAALGVVTTTGEDANKILADIQVNVNDRAQENLEGYAGKLIVLKNTWEDFLRFAGEHVLGPISDIIAAEKTERMEPPFVDWMRPTEELKAKLLELEGAERLVTQGWTAMSSPG